MSTNMREVMRNSGLAQYIVDSPRQDKPATRSQRTAGSRRDSTQEVQHAMSESVSPEGQDYAAFLAGKHLRQPAQGFEVPLSSLNAHLFPWQAEIVRWCLRIGKCAIFAECGLGKTIMELEYAKHVAAHTGRPVLILAPLAVAQQTRREAGKFGYSVTICRSQADVQPDINVTNYDVLDKFDPAAFGGVIADEGSILKNYMGVTKRALVDAFSRTSFRMSATATPAPNDHMEIGNQAEFLGIMPANEMLTRWFINDTMQMGTYRLKGHARADFWRWVASWAVSCRKPSDLGYPDEGFALPPLHLHHVSVPVDILADAGDRLFRQPELNATHLHREMRLTAPARAQAVAALVNGSPDTWAIWANMNYEADELRARIPDAIEVRGSDSLAEKERCIELFSTGQARVLISKASITGHGLNWQHCHKTVFVGLNYSFELLYQALRRFHRFGQHHPVDAYLVVAETEGPILTRVREKMAAHSAMFDEMAQSGGQLGRDEARQLDRYDPRVPMVLPAWLKSEVQE